MLQIKNICKSYTTGSFTQQALDNVSITLRDNEFVAILGPSGSGKTTFLNIVGGLDHYDSGDLVIDGISTKEYKDRDWDAYRNNRIGFVFQSYNLIPHQTVIANVELALTLSGVSKAERHERARQALERVGLGEHIDKKPSQLSGGQMQRVAIARALINDPEILLADEPTGALDSKTSVQIMDLLTEIASDRLVVMVTHNPDLAEEYATRIVNLSDGHITSDSDPYEPAAEELARVSAKKPRATSMSLGTALSLSFNNLMTKKGRTIMTAIAGSIGIVGIAAILALANGVNQYIANVEEETLSEYPLQITSSGMDMSSMLDSSSKKNSTSSDDSSSSDDATAKAITSGKDTVRVNRIMTSMLNSIGSNDLESLRTFLESGESDIKSYTNSIEYKYNVTPLLYLSDTSDGVVQVNPDDSFSAMGMGSSAVGGSGFLSSMYSTDVFYEMPTNSELYESQYEVVTGSWPKNYNECVLVISKKGYISDFMLYSLGLRDKSELKDMINAFMAEEEYDMPEIPRTYTYDDILGVTFRLVNPTDKYEYDSTYGVWKDKTSDADYLANLVNSGEEIKIVGIVKPSEDAKVSMLNQGINYTRALTEHIVSKSARSTIVQQQLDDPLTDVISGKTFLELEESTGSSFNMSNLMTIDESALTNAFGMDASVLTAALSNINITAADLPSFPLPDAKTFANLGLNVNDMTSIATATQQLMMVYIQTHPGCSANDLAAGFVTWFNDPTTVIPYGELTVSPTQVMQGVVAKSTGIDQVQDKLMAAISEYLASAVPTYTSSLVQIVVAKTAESLTSALPSAMKVDTSAFASAFKFNLSNDDLTQVITSMMSSKQNTYDGNLANLGYADFNEPYEIDIYPKDFESKDRVKEILDDYNARMEDAGQDEKVISYTDIVGVLMTSVTEIIDMISMVLIAFVAISLIVSSIMIGVITYISVLERIKEIGILRAIGARKSDISHVFNAETIIEGLVAGVLGIAITAVGCVIANIILGATGYPQVAQLPLGPALVLILISVVLTFIAGVIPARNASRKDPVEALRSE